MRLEHYIVDLLYTNNCIVVPGFGAFITNKQPAETHTGNGWMLAPTKSLSFNPSLTKNDGLLVSYVAEKKKLSHDDILTEVINHAATWMAKLTNGERLKLSGIGILWMSSENRRLLYAPEESTNYLTSSFGFSPVSLIHIKREKIKEEMEVLEEKVPFIITPEKRESKSLRPWLKYVAALLLFISLGATSFIEYQRFHENQLLVHQNATRTIDKTIQQATFFESTPLELPSYTIEVTKKRVNEEKVVAPIHHIVAGAFRQKKNAFQRVKELRKQGFNAKYIGSNKFNLHQVTFSSFSDKEEAVAFLKGIKKSVSKDAWMLSVKE